MTKQMCGFAVMDPEKRREIASKGGRAAHKNGTAHEWTGGPNGTAVSAGRKGGTISRGGKGKALPEPKLPSGGSDSINGEISGLD